MKSQITIINVNQFYPNYYIDTHEVIKINKISKIISSFIIKEK